MSRANTKQKKKAANGYKLAEPFPKGEVLEDVAKKKWKLGPSIGQGGFGEIYAAQEAGASGAKYPYVIKIDPHENGPLFVEMHFYIKCAKPDDVKDFQNQKGLKTFGMPLYLGSGSHEFNGEKYHFIVMEKFGPDLWKIFLQHNKHFPNTTVFKIAIQIIDILEYIHSKGYVHTDIKGENILLGATKETQNKQVYLVDFGLITKCNDDSEFKPNPKTAHNGTLKYLSRDAHNGVQTKRGDLETLAYNLIQWLGCVLPWEISKVPNAIQKLKEEYMSSIFKFIKACFDKRSPPGPIVDFLNYLSTLSHNSNPNYENMRKIFLSGLDSGDALGKPLQFTVPEKKTPAKRKNQETPKSSPKKNARKQVEKEESENEKENLDNDDLTEVNEEVLSNVSSKRGGAGSSKVKERKKVANRKGTNKNAKVTANDIDIEMETNEEKNGNEHVSESEESNKISNKTDETERSKGKMKINKKKTQIKGTKKSPQEEENKVNQNISDSEDMDDVKSKTSEENIETDNSKGKKKTVDKKKTTKSTTKVSEEENLKLMDEPVIELSIRTRGRGRAVNYKEDSDDEKRPSRKKSKNPPTKEIHITGDNLGGYTEAMKKVAQTFKPATTKKNAQSEDESCIASTSKEPLKKGRKKRALMPKEPVEN